MSRCRRTEVGEQISEDRGQRTDVRRAEDREAVEVGMGEYSLSVAPIL